MGREIVVTAHRRGSRGRPVADFVNRRRCEATLRSTQDGFWCDGVQGDVCGEGDLVNEEESGFRELSANERGEEIGGKYAGENTVGGGGGGEKASEGVDGKDEPTRPNVKPVLCPR